MAERLGLGVIPGVGWSAHEVQTIARQAEEAGFDAIFVAEVNNDVMATAQLMGTATTRITAHGLPTSTCGTPMSVRRGRHSLPTPLMGAFSWGLA